LRCRGKLRIIAEVTTEAPPSLHRARQQARFSQGAPRPCLRELERGRIRVGNLQVMGFEGFSDNESMLHHLQSPCRVSELGSFTALTPVEWVPAAHAAVRSGRT
jgi:hypothetical protein